MTTALQEALHHARTVLLAAFAHLALDRDPEEHQVLIYDLVHAYAATTIALNLVSHDDAGPLEAKYAWAFGAEAVRSVLMAVLGKNRTLGLRSSDIEMLTNFLEDDRDPASLIPLAEPEPPRHLDPELEEVSRVFRNFGMNHIDPVAYAVHRRDDDIPETVIDKMAKLGAFGISIDTRYGGSSEVGGDLLGMVIATEELSYASLSIGGSLLTRPEILVRALQHGGTPEQREEILPRIARGEAMVAVAVTEPDHGSDVAGIRMGAVRDGQWWVLNGVKTWCTFAGRADLLAVLARTGPGDGHRGLSLFMVEKGRTAGHSFVQHQEDGGELDGRAIPTIGYRGLHSFEISFKDWRVPHTALVGGDHGIGQGFYLQMAGFEVGRLQTAARAIGLMQRAYEEGRSYVQARSAFSRRLEEYELTRHKLGRMAAVIHACRQYLYHVAEAAGEGADVAIESALIKVYASKVSEWVTREAMQLHGGYGYAEEYLVSRLFVDARVLSIFEGTDEVLSIRVLGRWLLQQAPRVAE